MKSSPRTKSLDDVDGSRGLMAEVRRQVEVGDSYAAGRAIPNEILDRFAISGTPEQVASHVTALFDAGVDRVELGTPHGLTAERGVELIGSKVLPLLSRVHLP